MSDAEKLDRIRAILAAVGDDDLSYTAAILAITMIVNPQLPTEKDMAWAEAKLVEIEADGVIC